MRGFYLIFGHLNDIDWPEELDLKQPRLPVFWEVQHSMYAKSVPRKAFQAFDKEPSPRLAYMEYDLGAYLVISPAIARLVWRKRRGRFRGRWEPWHGNPTHKQFWSGRLREQMRQAGYGKLVEEEEE